jgi:hypothetical protein
MNGMVATFQPPLPSTISVFQLFCFHWQTDAAHLSFERRKCSNNWQNICCCCFLVLIKLIILQKLSFILRTISISLFFSVMMNNLNLFDKNMNNFYDSVIVIFGFGRNYWIMVEQHNFCLSFFLPWSNSNTSRQLGST